MMIFAFARMCLVSSLAVPLAVVGCGGAAPNAKFSYESASVGSAPSSPPGQTGGSAPKSSDSATASRPEDAKRMILYSATVDVVVKDLDAVRSDVTKLIEQNKGYVAGSEIRGNTGSVRSAQFTIRVPADNFDKLKGALLALGVPERDMVKSDDVTAEYYDLQGRLKNLRTSQERLLELKKQASVKEILEIETQLERVNEKIEQIEGRLKYITTFAALSTISLTMREIQDYKPPTAPTFSSRITETFENSWKGLIEFGKGCVLFVVALGPWLPVLIPCGLLGIWLLRRLKRSILKATEETVERVPPPPAFDVPPPPSLGRNRD